MAEFIVAIELGSSKMTGIAGKITLTNVKTASPIYIKGMIDVLDFKTKGTMRRTTWIS